MFEIRQCILALVRSHEDEHLDTSCDCASQRMHLLRGLYPNTDDQELHYNGAQPVLPALGETGAPMESQATKEGPSESSVWKVGQLTAVCATAFELHLVIGCLAVVAGCFFG